LNIKGGADLGMKVNIQTEGVVDFGRILSFQIEGVVDMGMMVGFQLEKKVDLTMMAFFPEQHLEELQFIMTLWMTMIQQSDQVDLRVQENLTGQNLKELLNQVQ